MPNDNDLIERYLYAITRRLPADQRVDVAEELRTLISDMLEERCAGLAPTPKDVRVVLTELGTPGEMVRKYTDGEGKCLIGQPYYSQYIFMLKLVLGCVTGGMIIAGLLSLAVGAPEGFFVEGIGWLGSLLSGFTFAFSFVTLIFAVFSRKGIEVEVMGSLDDLPPVPRASRISTRGNAVAGIVFSILGLVVFLLFPEVLNTAVYGTAVELFDIEAIRSSAWIIIAWTLICLAGESFMLIEGRYTLRVFIVTVAVDVVAAALVVFWLTNYQIIDSQALVQVVTSADGTIDGWMLKVLENAQMVFCGLVVVALVIDVIDTAVKTFGNQRKVHSA